MSDEKNVSSLYHFTTMNGLLGIVGNNKIWFTDYRFLNDKNEISIIYNNLIAKLKDINYIKSSKQLQIYFNNFTRNYSLGICSFSNNYDSLAQWRLYADDCQGACIGFNRSLWDTRSAANWKSFPPITGSIYDECFKKPFVTDLIKCEYKDINDYVNELTIEFNDYFIEIEKNDSKLKDIPSLSSEEKLKYINLLKRISAWKHMDFSYEKEERSISITPKTDIKIRASHNSLIPYYELNISPSFSFDNYHMIILGAKCDPNTNEAIEYLFDYHVQYDEVDGPGYHKLEYYAKQLANEHPDKYRALTYCAHQITAYR